MTWYSCQHLGPTPRFLYSIWALGSTPDSRTCRHRARRSPSAPLGSLPGGCRSPSKSNDHPRPRRITEPLSPQSKINAHMALTIDQWFQRFQKSVLKSLGRKSRRCPFFFLGRTQLNKCQSFRSTVPRPRRWGIGRGAGLWFLVPRNKVGTSLQRDSCREIGPQTAW